MAAQPRAFGYCFNPISVFWCFDRAGEQRAVVVEVHNTYGDRHAYLVHPDAAGPGHHRASRCTSRRSTAPTAPTSSPCRLPGDRLHVAVTLHADDGAVFSASLYGQPHRPPARSRAAPAALRSARC